MFVVGVKFCGGCNEQYDRKEAFEKIKKHFMDKKGEIDFVYVEDGGKYDALLLMSGCTNRCAAVDKYDYDDKLISVWKAGSVEGAIELIQGYYNYALSNKHKYYVGHNHM